MEFIYTNISVVTGHVDDFGHMHLFLIIHRDTRKLSHLHRSDRTEDRTIFYLIY